MAISASVDASVLVQAYDETGTASTTGGFIYYIHVYDRCALNLNFFCEETALSSHILDPPIMKMMTDNGDGTYSATYSVNVNGLASVDVLILNQGGFYAEYFNNAFLDGIPAIARIDSEIDFDWGTGLVTNDVADFVSIRWYGKVMAPATEEFTFIIHADDSVRFYLDGKLLIDRWDTCCEDVTATVSLVQGILYDIRLEYKEYQEQAYISLMWTSLSIPKNVISPVYMYYPTRVGASPYPIIIDNGPSKASKCNAYGDGLSAA